ncbi:hypothetical protein F0365_12325 [Nonlabens sp. Ci31]|jgi:hypothetical protein|uniref:hypothetical protein n=1 Tax=Nonlabens sp. Ci31 TaxID=2608253 RepID=UPI001463E278|nr:hypothetical protein [Nonlabens sp. Ci31]QJP35117.1 hypothetical protein F0365_12325 [Nonlabens sp. Ci31]
MKNLIIQCSIIAIILCSATVNAQQYLPNDPTPAQEEKAKEIVVQFDSVLSLTTKQELLFDIKQTEFIVSQELLINSNTPKEELNRMLLALYLDQAMEMKDILTQPQYDLYAKVRSTYDPLLVIL